MVTYVKISDLPPATAATGDSELEVNQAGITRKITVDQVADVIAAILPPPDMSDYATDEEVADAIAAIPPADWGSITNKPDFNALYVNVAGDTMTGALLGTTATMSGNIVTNGGYVMADRRGDAAGSFLYSYADAGQTASLHLGGGTGSNRWSIFKNATAETGSNVGSNLQIFAFDDAGASLGNALTITRSNFAVALTGALTGTSATMTSNITTNGGYVMVDRTGDATAASIDIRSDSGQLAILDYRTGSSIRWRFQKTSTVEVSPTNVGSDFALTAYDDVGASLGNAFVITRATRAISFGGALTGTSATMSSNIVTNGGYMMLDRIGDAVGAVLYMRSDPGQVAQIALQSASTNGARWAIHKTATAESGANVGSDFQIFAYDDVGASLGSALTITRSTLATALSGALSGTTATFSAAPAYPNNTTSVATTAFVTSAVAAATSALVPRVQQFSASGTYTPHANMVYCWMRGVGGGGGGGGTAVPAANVNVSGGGGGSGGYGEAIATKADVGASRAVTIGAAGAASATGNNPGGAGGATSVATLLSVGGGGGGAGNTGATVVAGGTGGTVTTGNVVTVPGSPGSVGAIHIGAVGVFTIPEAAYGGSGPFGNGGRGNFTGSGPSNGNPGTGRGSGGAGGQCMAGGGTAAGGAGAAGFVVIIEYCSS